MSTNQKSQYGYKFTVQGKYYAENEHGKSTLKFYPKQTFILPEIVTYVQGNKFEYFQDPKDPAMSKKRSVPNKKTQNVLKCFKYVIKNYYLEPRLKEKCADYIKYRTYQVVSRSKRFKLTTEMIKEFNLDIPLDEMSESQLIQFVALKSLNVDLKNYDELIDKKTAVEYELGERLADRPGIDRDYTQAEIDLLPPPNAGESFGAVSSEDGVPIDEEDDMAAFK